MLLTETIVGDVAASVTLMSLCDATSGAPVPLPSALPQPFASAGAGVWTFQFTEPAAWLTYRYVYQITWGDGTSMQLEGVRAAGNAQATGRYATQADIEAIFGTQNIALWADLDNTQNALAMTARIAAGLAYADDTVDNTFRGGAYAVPLVLHSGQNTLTHWAAVIAGHWLYANRGQRDDDKVGDRYQLMLDAVMAQMRQCRTGQTLRIDADSPVFAFPQPQSPVVV